MTKNLTALVVLTVLAAPGYALVAQGQLEQSADLSAAAASASSLSAAKGGVSLAMGEGSGAPAVQAGDTRGQFRASMANEQGPAATTPPKKAKAEPPSPGKGGFLKGAGDTLKKYTPHLLAAGVGAAGGAAVAAVAGAGLIGGALTGAGLGLAALYLMKKGETGAAIGAISFGIAGLAIAGPVGGIVGALVGGFGAWALGKFFS